MSNEWGCRRAGGDGGDDELRWRPLDGWLFDAVLITHGTSGYRGGDKGGDTDVAA